jgi:undecaprenyl phosphate N,N'-diacetylbacillosamine 1-phosphate transferase
MKSDKYKHHVWYLDNLGFLLEIKIIFLIIKKVLNKTGANSNTSATMQAF